MRNRGGKHSTAVTYGNHQIAVPCRLLSEIKERTHHMSLTWVAHALQQTPRRMERRATGWDKVCAHHTSNSELASKTTQRTLKTLGKKTNSPASKWTKDVTRTSLQMHRRWISTWKTFIRLIGHRGAAIWTITMSYYPRFKAKAGHDSCWQGWGAAGSPPIHRGPGCKMAPWLTGNSLAASSKTKHSFIV